MVPTRYYVVENDVGDREEFENSESLLFFLSGRNQEQGEFFIHDNKAVKIEYDTITGEVHTVGASDPVSITNFYSFKSLKQPISEAIALLAKYELIKQLDSLGDERVSAIIQKNGLDKQLTKAAIYKTLLEIEHECEFKPNSMASFFMPQREKNDIQKSIYAALKKIGIENIKSKRTVNDIMQSIQEEIHQPKLKK